MKTNLMNSGVFQEKQNFCSQHFTLTIVLKFSIAKSNNIILLNSLLAVFIFKIKSIYIKYSKRNKRILKMSQIKLTFLIGIVLLCATITKSQTPTSLEQCSAAGQADADEAFNKVDVVTSKLSNSSASVAVLEKFVQIGAQNVGIYTFDNPIGGNVEKIQYIFHSNNATSSFQIQEANLGGDITALDALRGTSAAVVDLAGFEYQQVTGTAPATTLVVKTYNLLARFKNGATVLNATQFLFKGIVDLDTNGFAYTLWQATNSKFYIFLSDGTNMNVYRSIDTAVGAALICGSIDLCYDTVSKKYYKGTTGIIAMVEETNPSVLTLVSEVQFIQLRVRSDTIAQILRSSSVDGKTVQRYVFEAYPGVTPSALVASQPSTFVKAPKIFRGYDNQLGQYDGATLYFLMGFMDGTDKWVLKFYSAGVLAFNNYIASNVLQISFTNSKVIVLKKTQFLQFYVKPAKVDTNSGVVDLQALVWITTFDIQKQIILTDSAQEQLVRPVNNSWLVIRNKCFCVQHAVKDMICFNNYHCVVAIDFVESDCSAY